MLHESKVTFCIWTSFTCCWWDYALRLTKHTCILSSAVLLLNLAVYRSSQSIVFQKIRNAVVEIDVPALRVACGCTRSLQSCLTLYDAMDCSPLGSSLHMILQVRILEWIAMPSFRGSSQPRDQPRVFWGSCIAGRFFTDEPPGKPGPKQTWAQSLAQSTSLLVTSGKVSSLSFSFLVIRWKWSYPPHEIALSIRGDVYTVLSIKQELNHAYYHRQ